MKTKKGLVLKKNALTLIDDDKRTKERRETLRLPFKMMTFRAKELPFTFEVTNISTRGMRIGIKDGDLIAKIGQKLSGNIKWKKTELRIEAEIVWSEMSQLGLKFTHNNTAHGRTLNSFFNPSYLAKGIRIAAPGEFGFSTPSNLALWLTSDGPFEFFVWRRKDGSLSKIEALCFEYYFEWVSGKGLKSGEFRREEIEENDSLGLSHLQVEFHNKIRKEALEYIQQVLSSLELKFLSSEEKDYLELAKRRICTVALES